MKGLIVVDEGRFACPFAVETVEIIEKGDPRFDDGYISVLTTKNGERVYSKIPPYTLKERVDAGRGE